MFQKNSIPILATLVCINLNTWSAKKDPVRSVHKANTQPFPKIDLKARAHKVAREMFNIYNAIKELPEDDSRSRNALTAKFDQKFNEHLSITMQLKKSLL